MTPSTTKQWTLDGSKSFDSLKLKQAVSIPELRERDVLVKFHYASLNYRDLIISNGQYPEPHKPSVVPGSDGAGTVQAVGAGVTRFKEGDKVLTCFNPHHVTGSLNPAIISLAHGNVVDGTLRQYGAFDEQSLVAMPETLDFKQASTLTCAGVTAWNALFGLQGHVLKPGNWVLTQGTGGVSIFAVQFAKAAGARIIATTSSDKKGDILKRLGADHVINYKTNSNWGEAAKKLTPNGEGVDQIVEVGGPNSITQSLDAIKIDGMITMIGFLGGIRGTEPSYLEAFLRCCLVRGVQVGNRAQFEEMNRAVDAYGIKPMVDEKEFGFEELKEAYQYMWNQKHFGKLTIKID